MSAEPQLPPARAYLERTDPFSKFMIDARARLDLSHRELAAEITDAAYDLNQVASTVHGSATYRWEHGVVAHHDVRRWIAYVLKKHGIDISEADLELLAQAQKHARRSHKPAHILDQPPDQNATIPARGRHSPNSPDSAVHDVDGIHLSAAPSEALIASGDPSDRLQYVLKHPARIDTPTLSHIESVLIALETIERHVEANALIGATLGHLGSLTSLLTSPLPSSTRRQVCSIAAETACLAARLYAQISDTVHADSYFRSALNAAREGDDRPLAAYIIGIMAGQLRYRHDPALRVTLLMSTSSKDATPATRVFLAAKEADAYALVGDRRSCLAALDRAQVALEHVSREHQAPRPRAPWWPHETWLAGERASTLARLGQHRDAEQLLNVALRQAPNPKHRLWLMAALARIRATSQEPEEASRIAIDVIADAKPLQMTTVTNEIAHLRTALDAWSDTPSVRDLDEALRDQHRLLP